MGDAAPLISPRRPVHVLGGGVCLGLGLLGALAVDPLNVFWEQGTASSGDILAFVWCLVFAVGAYWLGVKPSIRMVPGGIEITNPMRRHVVAADDVTKFEEAVFVYPCIRTANARYPIFALEVRYLLDDGCHWYVRDLQNLHVASQLAKVETIHTQTSWRRPDLFEILLAGSLVLYLGWGLVL